ncbi:MAG TPA: DinB family protein [Pyrinomonadaceae bacterium]
MSVDPIIAGWREVRAGLIDEVSQIPADKFSFRAAEGMRSVAELLQHLVESQKFLVGEACRPDTNLLRKSFAEDIKDYAPDVRTVNDKEAIIQMLQTAMDDCEKLLREHADEMKNTMKRFDGKEMTKLGFMSFAIAHEMYHRGQLTVYVRLLGIEPMLTQKFRKAFGASPP